CNWTSLAIAANSPATDTKPQTNLPTRLGYAVWYRVPLNSLAHRRAQGCDFTAAHNHLPLGTLVRVTRLSNGKTVLVRITDRGIPRGQCAIDICQEAAEQIGILSKGIARVRLEVFPKSMTVLNLDRNHPTTP